MLKRRVFHDSCKRYSFAFAITCSTLIALYSNSSLAQKQTEMKSTPPTVTIDVLNSKGSVDYEEVSRFLAEQNKKQVKYAKADKNTIILSEKPIIQTDTQTIYSPSKLHDLGFEMSKNLSLSKINSYHLSANLNNVMKIPKFAASKRTVAINTANQNKLNNKIHSHASNTPQPVNIIVFISLILVISVLSLASVLMLSLISRRSELKRKSTIYSGVIDNETEMIGKGNLFDFDRENPNKMPMHITYMDMIWQLGRFSHNNSIDTYFYMATFIPSYKNYARILRRKVAVKTKETD
ncbi:MAG TPA: hypothetical protein VL360_07730 [Gammaproteobacteria bacterium]|nr:hypothetical protein [Gammaproteobacteria bacterium]